MAENEIYISTLISSSNQTKVPRRSGATMRCGAMTDRDKKMMKKVCILERNLWSASGVFSHSGFIFRACLLDFFYLEKEKDATGRPPLEETSKFQVVLKMFEKNCGAPYRRRRLSPSIYLLNLFALAFVPQLGAAATMLAAGCSWKNGMCAFPKGNSPRRKDEGHYFHGVLWTVRNARTCNLY